MDAHNAHDLPEHAPANLGQRVDIMATQITQWNDVPVSSSKALGWLFDRVGNDGDIYIRVWVEITQPNATAVLNWVWDQALDQISSAGGIETHPTWEEVLSWDR